MNGQPAIRPLGRRPIQRISVLIVEDHPLFREGLRLALELEDDLHIVGHCSDGQTAVDWVLRDPPRVVLLDVNLPGMNGLQVLKSIKRAEDSVAVIVLTAYHDDAQVLHAMRAGASAYCPKDVLPDDLVKMIREVAAGYYWLEDRRMDAAAIHRWISDHIEAGPFVADARETYAPLSQREMEILEFVVNGLSNKLIANKLSISQQTVKNHMTSILKKLNVEDRTQAAVTAIKRGWVRL